MAKTYSKCGKCGKKGVESLGTYHAQDRKTYGCKYCRVQKPYFNNALKEMFPGETLRAWMQQDNFAAEHIADDLLHWKPAERIIHPTTMTEVLAELAAAQTALASIYHLYEEVDRALTTVKKYMDEQKVTPKHTAQESDKRLFPATITDISMVGNRYYWCAAASGGYVHLQEDDIETIPE